MIDIPSGDGRASYVFLKKGAAVLAFDLYPEFMKAEGVKGQYADLNDGIPVEDGTADYLICQEGIEHMPDKVSLFREFNRVLKKGGKLIISAPSISHVRARMSMFIIETDFWRRMPPTEIDSLWFTEEETDRLYFGHLFLVGVQHLQTVCTMTGFKVSDRLPTALSTSSIIFGVFLYPLLALLSLRAYFAYRNKNKHVEEGRRKAILWERVKLNLSPRTLLSKHIFWVLEKDKDFGETVSDLKELTRET